MQTSALKRFKTGPKSSKRVSRRPRVALRTAAAPRSSEVKFFSNIQNDNPVSNTGAVTVLTPIAEGDDTNNRDGRLIHALSMDLRCWFQCGGNTIGGASTGVVRFIIFKWVDFTAPTATDILVSAVPEAPFKQANNWQYRVLYDKTIPLNTLQVNQGFTGAYAPACYQIGKNIKLDFDIAYRGGLSTELGPGQIYVLRLCSEANFTKMNLGTAVYFTDK